MVKLIWPGELGAFSSAIGPLRVVLVEVGDGTINNLVVTPALLVVVLVEPIVVACYRLRPRSVAKLAKVQLHNDG
jgi:hypothetical protein